MGSKSLYAVCQNCMIINKIANMPCPISELGQFASETCHACDAHAVNIVLCPTSGEGRPRGDLSHEGPISKKQFMELTPFSRGYVGYMFGERDDQPNVPDEENPFRKDSLSSISWDRGQQAAVLHVQDIP